MSRSRFIFIMVMIIAVGTAFIFYFYHIFNMTQPVLQSALELQDSMQNMSFEFDDQLGDKLNTDEEDLIEQLYSYQNDFRNPFENLQADGAVDNNQEIETRQEVEEQKQEALTVEKIKSLIPFALKGTIGSKDEWLALLETTQGTRIMKKNDVLHEFRIDSIYEKGLILTYKGISFKLEMGSGNSANN